MMVKSSCNLREPSFQALACTLTWAAGAGTTRPRYRWLRRVPALSWSSRGHTATWSRGLNIVNMSRNFVDRFSVWVDVSRVATNLEHDLAAVLYLADVGPVLVQAHVADQQDLAVFNEAREGTVN